MNSVPFTSRCWRGGVTVFSAHDECHGAGDESASL